MIERFRAIDAATAEAINSQDYALNLAHKHVPEMQHYSGTAVRPIFTPMVANYYKGMLVHVPLFRDQELGGTAPAAVHEALADRYAGQPFVRVLPYGSTDMLDGGYLNPTAMNDSNNMELMVFGNDEQILLVARYDNLGKGASGAAVQNLNIMLGMKPQAGL